MKIAIIGAGKLGSKLAESLIRSDHDVVLIDNNAQVLQRINEHLDVLTINSNGVQIETLNKIKTYDLIIACTESDEKNMIICSIAKKLGCDKAIARIRDPEYVKQLDLIKKEMNIDHVVNPDMATSNEIFRYLVKSYTLFNELFVKGKVGMIEFNVGSHDAFSGNKLREISNQFNNMLIVAISRDGKIIIPHGDTELFENDILFIIGEKENILNFVKRNNVIDNSKYVKNVMIMGGGKIGYYLAEKLSHFGVNVKIIEIDRDRCKYLSENLDNVLILHGDGTDINLLEEESIETMDAFVATSGFDEENLLISLLARQYGVREVIAKVSRPSYVDIIEKLGINMAINPVSIISGNILRFVQGRNIVTVSHLLQGQAEVIEIITHDKMNIINIPLSELNLPQGIIIGSIVRDDTVIIPNGKTIILPNDRVVVFCRLSEVPELENLLKPRGGLFK
ncbi:MAG: Trk system potassium transporter TrkA [Clostridiales bacterium]|nr:Trk system potassium transporter TrkA [Clostridiales bacterium]